MTGKEQTKPSNFWEKLRGKFKGSPNTMEKLTNGESCIAFFFSRLTTWTAVSRGMTGSQIHIGAVYAAARIS
jgi:hypothetical protein